MSKPKAPVPAKLFLSAIYRDPAVLDDCLNLITERFGPPDHSTPEHPFTATRYYAPEMGEPLLRRFFSFGRLVDPGDLVEVKLLTNSYEIEAAQEGRRRINLDPGILSMNNLILATGKPAPHRPYLGKGIYADLTLVYERGHFRPLPWTYPDYAHQQTIAFLNQVRESYKQDLKGWKSDKKND